MTVQVAEVGRLHAFDSIAPKSADSVFMSDALLFDPYGAVGRALQTLLLRRR